MLRSRESPIRAAVDLSPVIAVVDSAFVAPVPMPGQAEIQSTAFEEWADMKGMTFKTADEIRENKFNFMPGTPANQRL